jgi:hypothetical protein
MASTLARFESSGLLPLGTPKNLVYAAPVDNEEAFHRIVDACQTIRSDPSNFKRMRQSTMRRVKACVEFYAGHLEHLL